MSDIKKVKITETALRDSHQSLVATRMKTEEMIPILEAMDAVGYHSLEAWGGATFDACLRFLNEDPWERLRTIRKHVKNTKLQMLFRGQNILGYRHYSDDVVDYFVAKSIENGMFKKIVGEEAFENMGALEDMIDSGLTGTFVEVDNPEAQISIKVVDYDN